MSWLTDTLARAITERGLTVEAAARQLAVERSRLANILAGAALPNDALTRRIARLLGEDPDVWLAHVEKRADARAPPPPARAAFVPVAKITDVVDGQMRIVCDGRAVLARADGQLIAFGNACPHAGAALGEGLLKGCVVKCPWHAGRWDVTTGQALTLLETTPIPIFEVRVQGDDVELRLDDPAAPPAATAD